MGRSISTGSTTRINEQEGMVLVVAVVMLVHVPVDPARGLARVDIGDCILFRKLEDDKENPRRRLSCMCNRDSVGRHCRSSHNVDACVVDHQCIYRIHLDSRSDTPPLASCHAAADASRTHPELVCPSAVHRPRHTTSAWSIMFIPP